MPLCYRLLSCLYMRCRLANLRARIFWVCRFFNLAYQKKADFFRSPLMPHAPAPRPWRLHPWDYWRPLFVMHTHLLWLRHCRPSWHTTSTIWWRRRSVLSFCIAANIFISVLRWATFERSTVITWGVPPEDSKVKFMPRLTYAPKVTGAFQLDVSWNFYSVCATYIIIWLSATSSTYYHHYTY